MFPSGRSLPCTRTTGGEAIVTWRSDAPSAAHCSRSSSMESVCAMTRTSYRHVCDRPLPSEYRSLEIAGDRSFEGARRSGLRRYVVRHRWKHIVLRKEKHVLALIKQRLAKEEKGFTLIELLV